MKKSILPLLLAAALMLGAGCSGEAPAADAADTSSPAVSGEADAAPESSPSSQVATADQMTTIEDVVEEGMVPVTGDLVKDGVYSVTVDSSSSMFKITACELTVENGVMTAVMHMSGTSYLKVFMGTGEEAAAAGEEACIPFQEAEDGTHFFTVPVEALDQGIACAAYSKNKELWYDRTLLFRADSLPLDAFQDGFYTTVASLGLADGAYQVDVSLEGGSGKAGVASPARFTVEDGQATVTIVMSSSNYDYMKVNGVSYDPVTLEGGSTFEIPLLGFDWKMPVSADTTAMSTPYEIDYTLYFDSSTIQASPIGG